MTVLSTHEMSYWPMVDVRAMLFSLYGMMDVLSELGCSLALFRNEEGKYEACLAGI